MNKVFVIKMGIIFALAFHMKIASLLNFALHLINTVEPRLPDHLRAHSSDRVRAVVALLKQNAMHYCSTNY